MSAYVVENETVNKILSTLQHEKNGIYLLNELREKFGLDLQTDTDFDQFGRAIFLLNVQAVNARYGEEDDGAAVLEDFRYRRLKGITKIQAYKALQCLTYQCNEGKVPQTELFKALDLIGCRWAEDIVSKLEAYDKAPWG